jgi:hypothetical protein
MLQTSWILSNNIFWTEHSRVDLKIFEDQKDSIAMLEVDFDILGVLRTEGTDSIISSKVGFGILGFLRQRQNRRHLNVTGHFEAQKNSCWSCCCTTRS